MTLPAHRYLERAKKPEQDVHNFAFDIDGVLDAFPRQIGTLITALTAAAHHVYIITGVDGDTSTQADVDAKEQFLVSLGLARETYFELLVVPEPHAENKAKALQENDIGVLFDNSKGNAKAARKAGVLALLVTNTKEP